MRDAKGLNLRQCLPRMSWGPRNLFNTWRRSSHDAPEAQKPPYEESRMVTFRKTRSSLFQQRWKSKSLVRGYHGDHINEEVFKRWYLPNILPDVRPKQAVFGDDKNELDIFARRARVEKERKRLKEEEEKGIAPVGSLMFMEVERRIDVFIFRCCFAHSVYEARRLVIHGYVLLNGKKHQNANTRLAPGDMVSVDPKAIRLLQLPAPTKDTPESTAPQFDHPSPLTQVLSQPDADGNPLTPFTLPDYASPFLFIPAYIEVAFQICSAVYVRHPTARPGYSEIPTPYDADGEIDEEQEPVSEDAGESKERGGAECAKAEYAVVVGYLSAFLYGGMH
ncbi:hypothetical protein PILCRDRAFT_825945 [Piloderma croceum F 1598]|uniref:RNA-binding S4 domain-containing protein n=1 Tax=Piloderma croceum (strain F 1598) TaxID=765440 RepID=A0A0C3FAI8_PILCF|nr:hypothetical protein PILCRDRAFT_825945 [Piloderma croceum F 1598]